MFDNASYIQQEFDLHEISISSKPEEVSDIQDAYDLTELDAIFFSEIGSKRLAISMVSQAIDDYIHASTEDGRQRVLDWFNGSPSYFPFDAVIDIIASGDNGFDNVTQSAWARALVSNPDIMRQSFKEFSDSRLRALSEEGSKLAKVLQEISDGQSDHLDEPDDNQQRRSERYI